MTDWTCLLDLVVVVVAVVVVDTGEEEDEVLIKRRNRQDGLALDSGINERSSKLGLVNQPVLRKGLDNLLTQVLGLKELMTRAHVVLMVALWVMLK